MAWRSSGHPLRTGFLELVHTAGVVEQIAGNGGISILWVVLCLLASLSRRQNTDVDYQSKARLWRSCNCVVRGFHSAGVYYDSGYFTIYGALYLLSLFLAVGVTIRMRRTIETIA